MVRNGVCFYSTSNEQNNFSQYVTSTKNNTEGAQGGVYDKIPDHSDLQRERKREGAITQ